MEINAMAVMEEKESLKSWNYTEIENLEPFNVLIEIQACGICYSDIHMQDNDWNASRYPLVPGHEIIGQVTELGDQVQHLSKGDRVGIGWQRSSCLQCEQCLAGNENLCSVAYEATIIKHHGGFASHMVVDSRFAFNIPKNLDSNLAGPLLCGGITVYSGLRSAGMTSGQDIGIIGLGGLGHMAVQFASKLGNKVTVFTRSKDKEEFAYKLGAAYVVNTKDEVPRKLAYPRLDIMLNTVDRPMPWSHFVRLLKADGTLCFVGNPGKLEIQIGLLLEQRRRIMGSPIGGRAEIRKMLEVANRYKIHPIIEKFPLQEVNEAITKLRQNQIRYRAVLTMS